MVRYRIAIVVSAFVAVGYAYYAGLTVMDAMIYCALLCSFSLGIIFLFSSNDSPTARPKRSKGNELGSSNFATKDQILKWLKKKDKHDTALIVSGLRSGEKLVTKAGVPTKLYIPSSERNRHLLMIAKTGSGKTTKAILPILYHDCLCPHRSTIVIDSKPEMWDKLAGMTRKYNPKKNIMRFNPLDTMRSLSWNILSKVEDDTDAKLIANTLIMATDNPASRSDSPFFRNNALQLLTAMMFGLLHDETERLSMPRIHELLHGGKENLCNWLEQRPHAIRNARTFVELARSGSQNADTILSELGMRISAWDLKDVRATTFVEELDIEKLITEPTLFIVEFRESEIEMLRPMANVIVIELLRYLTKYAESCKGQTLPRPVGLVIDEFASALGRLPDIHVKLNTLRSRNVSIVAAIQSIAQIKANYNTDADSVIAGFSSKILMPNLDFQDSEWASKETGTMTVRFKTQNAGKNRKIYENFANLNSGFYEQVQQRAVLTPDEIGRPVDNIATFFLPNMPPFQGHLVPYYEVKEMGARIGDGDRDFTLRDKPIEYEEILPEAFVPQQEQVPVNGEPQRQAVGAIPPATKVVHLQNQESNEDLANKLEWLKANKLDWANTTGVAREWWEAFEKENRDKMRLVVKLGEELAKRRATISEFFLAYVYSNSESIEKNLQYLDQMKANEAKSRSAEAVTTAAA
jgi:type IV secretory pathway TraG/TraD family ATPase VirD4